MSVSNVKAAILLAKAALISGHLQEAPWLAMHQAANMTLAIAVAGQALVVMVRGIKQMRVAMAQTWEGKPVED
jgi:hypothetical protein